jgi:hypothetical protein
MVPALVFTNPSKSSIRCKEWHVHNLRAEEQMTALLELLKRYTQPTPRCTYLTAANWQAAHGVLLTSALRRSTAPFFDLRAHTVLRAPRPWLQGCVSMRLLRMQAR